MIDISEKRAERGDAAPLTSDLLARKGEAVSAARDVLNAQAATTLPPAARQEEPSPRLGFVLSKQWIAAAAIVLIGGSMAVGYLSRPAIDEPATVVKIPTPITPVAVEAPSTPVDGSKLTALAEKSGPGNSGVPTKSETTAGSPDTQRVAISAVPPVAVEPKPVVVSATAPVAAPPSVQTLPQVTAPPIVEPSAINVPVEALPAKAGVPPILEVPAPPPIAVTPVAPAPVKQAVQAAPRPKPAAVKPPQPAKTVVAARTPPPVVAAPAAAVARPYMIQLVSVKSESAATREWERLQKRFSRQFGALDPSVQKVVLKKRGTFYRLRADGFETRRKATDACRKLKAAGQSCLVVKR